MFKGLISYLVMIGNNLCYKFRGVFVEWDRRTDTHNMQFDVGMKHLLSGNN